MATQTKVKSFALEYVKTIGIVNNGFNGRGFANPYDTAIAEDGRIFVLNRCDPARAAAIRIGICNLDEDYLGEFGYGYGEGDGQLIWPVAMAFDSGERLYVTDEHTNRITVFGPSGKFLAKWGTPGNAQGELSGPAGIAVDRLGGRIYWTEQAPARIRRAGLDGGQIEDLVTAGLVEPDDIELDTLRGKMYWSEPAANRISRADLDGSNAEPVYVVSGAAPTGLAIDVAAGMLYWTDAACGCIVRGPLDGGVAETLVSGLFQPFDIELDVAGGKMYWSEPNATTVQRANLDGSQVEFVFGASVIGPAGLGLDLREEFMYFTDLHTLRVLRVSFDLSIFDEVAGSGLREPWRLALELTHGAPGDMNCDGALNGADIDPFFLALGDPLAYLAAFPSCDIGNADVNGDRRVNGADIDVFFACLAAGACP